MSSTGSTTRYDMSFVPSGSGPTVVSAAFYAQDGFTDEMVIAFAQAVTAIAWPSDTVISFSKSVIDETDYTLNLTATPPAFV